MVLGSTQLLTEIILGGKGRLVYKADNLTTICELTAKKMGEP
jgi:hypothetical protein